MSFRYKKSLQTIAFLLVTCLANGYVFAVIPDDKSPADEVPEKAVPSGTLNTFGEQSVSVNGNIAYNGMTILSSAQIKTGKNSGATINLRQAGRIELCSETSARLVFTPEQVYLQLLSGQGKLTTYKGITGILSAADGKELRTDSKLETSSVGNCETTVVEVAPPVASNSTGLFGMGTWGTLGTLSGILGGPASIWFAARTGNREGTVSSVQP